MQEAGVGRIVLFNVGEGDRPMIITRVCLSNVVNGRVFLDGWNDSHLNFGVKNGPDCHVMSVNHGPNPGEWRFYDD